jgi:NADPH:quinone reductase-like Zn-dependent oxidoreductase
VTIVAGFQAVAGTLERVAALIAEGKLKVPIAARYPIAKTREAVTRPASRHVQGKVVVTLNGSPSTRRSLSSERVALGCP